MTNATQRNGSTRQYAAIPGSIFDHFLTCTKAHPLLSYLILAYATTWCAAALSWISIVFPLLGLFGPAAAAITVACCTDGFPAVSDMFGRLCTLRVGWRWWLIVLGLPAGIVLLAAALNQLLGTPAPSSLGRITPLMAAIGVLVVGEELGWRGYALPQLIKTHSVFVASIILGLVWAAWHIPNFVFLEVSSAHGRSFLAYVTWVVPFSVLMGWVFVNTEGSVLLATAFHASANLAGPVFGSTLAVQDAWLAEGALMAVLALGLLLALGQNLMHSRANSGRLMQMANSRGLSDRCR